MSALGFASLSPTERAWVADALALVCLIVIVGALYVAGGVS
jgi:hypothetical protein